MAETEPVQPPDPQDLSQAVLTLAGQSRRLMEGFLRRQMAGGFMDLEDVAAFLDLSEKMPLSPGAPPPAQPALWQSRFLFDHLRQSHLLAARWLQGLVAGAAGIDDQTRRKLDFYTRQFADALAPGGVPAAYPQALQATLASGGQNLLDGLSRLLEDLERGRGRLAASSAAPDAFRPGANLAVTPGKVVFQNELMQLLQYAPATPQVFRRPLLVVPPWINRYYVLDLRPANSLVKWWVEQGLTVFVVSWVNPGPELAAKGFEDYLRQGPLAALEAVAQASGVAEVNVAGYCLGGILLAAALAWLAARGDRRVKSASLFATLLDFAQPGDLEAFIDEEQLTALEQPQDDGRPQGSLTQTFSLLRANDLLWSYFADSYLPGRDRLPLDFLYWNCAATRLPVGLHRFYLHNLYQRNLLKEPGGVTLAGTPIDLGRIKIPVYFLAAAGDHIAPWKSGYASARLLSGPVRFVLAGSGHVAGVVNPPAAGRHGYRAGPRLLPTAEAWLDAAARQDGSWWPDWLRWAGRHGGGKVPARTPGDGGLAVIGDAPGAYATAG
ncbi:MAG: alpha/beta fold hydrolase [Pseudomonadota bacterium]|nr:alpha/beta fold hydrolase [Pseudomonadota bacterium]